MSKLLTDENDSRISFYFHMILAAIIVLLIVTMAGCVHLPHMDAKTRTLTDQQRAVVLVHTLCITGDPWTERFVMAIKTGSGVVIDDRHILTANHVVDCGLGDSIITVFFSNGKKWHVEFDKQDREHDLGRLQSSSAENFGLNLPPPILGTPLIGDSVCTAVAYPERGGHCGYLLPSYYPGKLQYGAVTAHGNSGGALYSDGKLVGIVTNLLGTVDAPSGDVGLASPVTLHPEWFAK